MKIFILSLQQPETEVEKITKLVYNNELVKLTINYTKYLTKDSMNSPLSFLCRLVLYDSKEKGFVKQFVDEKGLYLYEKFTLLGADSSTALILESLSLLSQMARFSKDYYEDINEIQPYADLRRLIQHTDPAIRSRVLNLIGNLCRHTNYFYEVMQKYDLIKECIRLCEDPDRGARKFACVAVGNAGFHDSSLYESLKPAIPVLVELLKDPEEKTRSNAAAALGNFVRNSALLDHEFVRTGAIYQLMNVVVNDSLLGPKKIALMSLNNLMSLPESSKVLMSLDIKKVVTQFLPPQFNG
jgi:fused-like protein